jgi:hypothetical protein
MDLDKPGKQCEPPDDVLGDTTVDNDGDLDGGAGPDVLGGRDTPDERAPGSVMPFTGTSIVAYVILALQMIGAGALIARGRKNR